MPTSLLSLLLLSAILVLGYSAPKYYLVETEDGLEGIYMGKIRKTSIQVNQVKRLMTMGICAHQHRWVSHQGCPQKIIQSSGSLDIAKNMDGIILIASV